MLLLYCFDIIILPGTLWEYALLIVGATKMFGYQADHHWRCFENISK